MEPGVFKKIGLKIGTNFVYRRILLLIFILFMLLVISYGFLMYQVRIINLKKIEIYSVYQERELYISKFYNSFNKNELIQELYAVTNDSKYLEIRKENLKNMQIELDSLYWFCRESDEYCIRLDSSRYFLDMYLDRFIPERDSIMNILLSDVSDSVEISLMRPEPDEFRIDTVRYLSTKEAEIKSQLQENLHIIERKIMGPTQWIVKSDRFDTSLNQKIIDAKINAYHFWQKIVVTLIIGLIFLLLIVLGFIIARPLRKPQPVYSTLPNLQYSAYEGFENEFVGLLQKHKDLFMKYKQIVLIFPRGSLFPIQIISAFQKFTQTNHIDFQIKDEIKAEILEEKIAFVILEEETMAQLIEMASETDLAIGDQLGILGYGDSPLKRIIANGITVIDISYQDCEPTGFRQIKPASNKCLSFVKRNSL
ncbi:MAG: hypothetical protein AMS23_06255 [Bacteroides sp. SM1_62]|nr:MAG: hypothetical protein AMS23_06255 [Bacteroides sp. SM1_62]